VLEETKAEYEKRMKWFVNARFGMFIHWGAYSVPARGEWFMYYEKIPPKEYVRYAEMFKPKKYDPYKWAMLARQAGMKYMVLTARHHDGFSLFESSVSDFTSVKLGPKRDLVAEYVKAVRKAGLKVGLYYSPPDWRLAPHNRGPYKDPKGFKKMVVEYVQPQIRELLTNYGKIDLLWFDQAPPIQTRPYKGYKIPNPGPWRSKETVAMVRKLQPHIIINDRSGLPGDYATSEITFKPPTPYRYFEHCLPINDHWGHHKNSTWWKSARQLLRLFGASVSAGGNFIVNVDPDPDGVIPAEEVRILKDMGRWMKDNARAMYGCTGSTVNAMGCGLSTAKGNTAYLHCHHWPGTRLVIPDLRCKVLSAEILASGKKLKLEQRGSRVNLSLPAKDPDRKIFSVIALKCDRNVET